MVLRHYVLNNRIAIRLVTKVNPQGGNLPFFAIYLFDQVYDIYTPKNSNLKKTNQLYEQVCANLEELHHILLKCYKEDTTEPIKEWFENNFDIEATVL